MTTIHTAATALPLIAQWETDNADNQESDIWNDLLYGLDGVDQEISDNELIAFTDGSRLEWTRDGWDAHPPEGGTPGRAEQIIETRTDDDGAEVTVRLIAETNGNHFQVTEETTWWYAARGNDVNSSAIIDSGWDSASAEQLLAATLGGFDLDEQEN